VGLENPKNNINIGNVMRAMGCFKSDLLAIKGNRFRKLGNIKTDTQKTIRRLPVVRCSELKEVVPFACVPIAVDLIEGAKPLISFHHPKNAFYIFGAEDATLGKGITDWCKYTVYIPTNYCLNLAAAVNIVLYDRLLKEEKNGHI
jgi:tRNA(Leu) C34 or U34 (ribose-2'-O)-methylase TrmL|tara:strand:- start:2468 stop:2902 length:435 start_codon:yes stop_codon:yes gene_type:complete